MVLGKAYTSHVHVLLCLVVCSTLLASFSLPSHLSLKHDIRIAVSHYTIMYMTRGKWTLSCDTRTKLISLYTCVLSLLRLCTTAGCGSL